MPYDIEPPEVWAVAHAVLDDAAEHARAAAMAEKARQWLQATAERGVPAEARESFLRRHAASCRAMGIGPA
jgi:uncharacterized phage protein gp47/JayE